MPKYYTERNAEKLDEAGNFYSVHVSAMTGENLHSKAAIASELAFRDFQISFLCQALDSISSGFGENKKELENYAEEKLIQFDKNVDEYAV